MKAVVLETAGERPVLRDEQRTTPAAKAGHALVRVEAAGVCHHDALIAAGVLRRGVRLPLVLGHEMAGVVEAVGDGVRRSVVGSRVVVLPGVLGHAHDGGFAEYVVVPEAALVAVPDGRDAKSAALLACPGGVALKAVEDVGGVVAGETVVVTGASGGLGIAAAQVSHALGARVLGVTTSASKVAELEAFDWLEAVLLDDGALPIDDAVRAFTDNAGADVIVDTVGGGGVRALVRSLARRGRLVLLGQVDASEASMSPAEVIFREARIVGSLGVERSHVERAIELAARGQLTPVVDRELGLSADAVGEALTLLRERAVTGRVVLRG